MSSAVEGRAIAYDGVVIGPGTVLAGRYAIQERLGSGAMGSVFRAEDQRLGREVAVKVLHDHVADAELRARFVREARILARIDHPGVVRVLDWVTSGETTALVMELVRGESLRARLDRDGAMPIAEAVRLGAALFDALAAAHAAGVIHRDVKPGNVVLAHTRAGAPELRLLDFGLARATALTALTETGTLLGTPAYLAPEVLAGAEADARSDVYSAGAVLYEMLAGARPFADKKGADLYLAIRDLTPAPVESARGGVPPEVATVVARAMGKAPERRFGSAGEARDALVDPEGDAHRAKEPTRPSPRRRRKRGRPVLFGLLAALVVAPILTAIVTFVASRPPRRASTSPTSLVDAPRGSAALPPSAPLEETSTSTASATATTAAPLPSTSTAQRTSNAGRCRCRMRIGNGYYGFLCLQLHTPVCECLGEATTCFEPWTNKGWGCAKQTVTGPSLANGQPCSGYMLVGGADGLPQNTPTTGRLHCDFCDMKGNDYGAGIQGAPCKGFSNTGASLDGAWECR